MRKETAVNIRIGANSSDFQKGMAAAKAAAKALQQDLQAIKAPPLPDLGRVLGLQRKQQFRDFEGEMKASLQRGTAALKVELERQAQAYREANRKMLPEMQRMQMSGSRAGMPGQWNHLQGTQFEGGSRGSAGNRGQRMANNAYGLGVGYNAIQDLVQGGPMAVANNVPQIIDLVAKSPALKMLGAAAFAAAGSFFAYTQISSAYDKHSEGRMQSRRLQTSGGFRAREREMRMQNEEIDAGLSGASEGEDLQRRAADRARTAQDQNEAMRRQEQLDALMMESRKLDIEGQKDKEKVIRELAALEIDNLQRVIALEAQRARQEEKAARKSREDLEAQYAYAKARIDEIVQGNRRAGSEMSDREKIELARLQALLPGLSGATNAARSRDEAARTRLMDSQAGQNQLPLAESVINRNANRDVQQLQEQRGRQNLNDFFNLLNNGLRQAAEAGRLYNDVLQKQQEMQRRRADLTKEVELAELQNSSPRKAEKMRKEMEFQDQVKQYTDAGMDPKEAEKLARRKQRAEERAANPRRIRGAGAGQEDERPSGLDYFDGKKMKGPETSALDEYEKRRSMPGVGKKLDQDMAEKEAAQAKAAAAGQAPKPTGDPTTHSLLKQMIDAITSLGSKLAAPAPAPAPAAT